MTMIKIVTVLTLSLSTVAYGGEHVREMLSRFVEANTTNPPGNEKRAVELVIQELKDAGISYEVTEFDPGRQNIVARLKAPGVPKEAPLLLLAHLDVVGADGQNWTVDPHKVTEKEGYLYGRGVGDDLSMAAVNLEVFLMLKKTGTALRRDVILALTGDEESGGAGIKHILKNAPKSLQAAVAFNEVGGPVLDDKTAKVKFVGLQVAEKRYQDFELVAHGTTGHSSVPRDDNAIARIGRAVAKIAAYHFPARLLPVTRAHFKARAAVESPILANAMRAIAYAKGSLPESSVRVLEADPTLSAILRTTCVPTTIHGGTRVNALPADAHANVNCRILPDETTEAVRARLEKTIADPTVEIRVIGDFGHAAPSPLDGEGPKAIEKISRQLWPNAPIIPMLSLGATDSRYLRAEHIDSYGFSPVAVSEADGRRAHGIDERIPVASLSAAVELMHRLVLELAQAR